LLFAGNYLTSFVHIQIALPVSHCARTFNAVRGARVISSVSANSDIRAHRISPIGDFAPRFFRLTAFVLLAQGVSHGRTRLFYDDCCNGGTNAGKSPYLPCDDLFQPIH
jgi:hypothetical protein